MKLYNYAIRTYRVYVIRRIFLLILTLVLEPLVIIMMLPDEEETVLMRITSIIFGIVANIAFMYNIIETIKLILDLKEGPQSRSMRFIEGTWDEINVLDYKWYWGWLKFRYSAAYVKGNNYIKYIKLRGTFSREKWDKINRMSSPRFEVVYFPRSKIMKELR